MTDAVLPFSDSYHITDYKTTLYPPYLLYPFLFFLAKLWLTAPTKLKTSDSSNRWAGLFIMDNRIPFQKPPLTLEGQVSLLKDRGLLIDDDDAAIRLLSNVNDDHLEGYWYPLYDKETRVFHEDIHLDQIVSHYEFD